MKALSLKSVLKGLLLILVLGLIGGYGVDTEARGIAITVCPSGCDFASVQKAVAAAQSGATVQVGAGEHLGPVLVTKSLRLLGAGPSRTTITKGVVVAGRANAILEGLTLTQGLNGLTARDAAVVTLRGSVIAGNAANGVAAFGRSQVILANVTITKNGISVLDQPIGGGIALRNQARLSTFNTSVTESGANGISLLDRSSANLGAMTTISRSGLNGVLLGGASTATARAVVVRESACYGVAVGDDAQAEIVGARIEQNAHAGLKIGGTSAILKGCSTQIDEPITARALVRDTFVSANPIGILIGDLSTQNESAVVTLRTLLVEKSPVCGILVDPEAPKAVTLEDMTYSENAKNRC